MRRRRGKINGLAKDHLPLLELLLGLNFIRASESIFSNWHKAPTLLWTSRRSKWTKMSLPLRFDLSNPLPRVNRP